MKIIFALRFLLGFIFSVLITCTAGYSMPLGDDDQNIIIENKTQRFEFVQTKAGEVNIKETYTLAYRCKDVREDILFSETYSNRETIDDVKIIVNGKRNKSIVPQYDYYSVKDIFYSDARICYFKLPFGKKDATAEVTLEKTHKDPRYFTKIFLSKEYLVQDQTVTFIIPRWMKVDIRQWNFEGNTITKTTSYDERADADVITYRATNLPAIATEKYFPGIAHVYPHLLILCKEAITSLGKQTYFNTLADQYKWCYSLVQELTDNMDELKVKATEITKEAIGDVNKVKALHHWVHQNIRYIAFEDGVAAFKPAPAMEVLNKRYGDCKGMANLLKGLLKSLGYDARLVWIGTNHIPYDISTPSLSLHNHMIAAWIYNGKTYFLDGTETNMNLYEYAERISGRQVLVENGKNFIQTNVPIAAPEQNTEYEKMVVHIEGEDIKGNILHTYKGQGRSTLINQMLGTKKENLEKSIINYFSKNNQDFQISNLKKGNIPGTDSVLTIGYDVVYKKAATVFGNDIYVEADFRKELDEFIIDTAIRKHNIKLPYKMNIVQETEITIPMGYKVVTKPTDLIFSNPNTDVSITYKVAGGKLLYKKQIKVKEVLVKKQDFTIWNKNMQQLTDKYKEQLIFSKQ